MRHFIINYWRSFHAFKCLICSPDFIFIMLYKFVITNLFPCIGNILSNLLICFLSNPLSQHPSPLWHFSPCPTPNVRLNSICRVQYEDWMRPEVRISLLYWMDPFISWLRWIDAETFQWKCLVLLRTTNKPKVDLFFFSK